MGLLMVLRRLPQTRGDARMGGSAKCCAHSQLGGGTGYVCARVCTWPGLNQVDVQGRAATRRKSEVDLAKIGRWLNGRGDAPVGFGGGEVLRRDGDLGR